MSWMTLVIRAVVMVNVVCAIAILGWVVWIWVGLPLRHPPPCPPVCLSNVKNITLALQMYLADNDEVFPPAAEWCDTLGEYVKNDDVYRCPQAPALSCAYAYNSALDGVEADSLSDQARTVAIFESDGGWNAAGGLEMLPAEPRHLGGDNYGLADGHAWWISREKMMSGEAGVRWEVE